LKYDIPLIWAKLGSTVGCLALVIGHKKATEKLLELIDEEETVWKIKLAKHEKIQNMKEEDKTPQERYEESPLLDDRIFYFKEFTRILCVKLPLFLLLWVGWTVIS